jgi:TolB protein
MHSRCLRIGGVLAFTTAAFTAAAIFFALPAAAQQRPAVVVTPGMRQSFKAAVQRFAETSAAPGEGQSAQFRDSLSEALLYSGVFEMIDPKAFLGPDQTTNFESNTSLACADWTTVGTDVFIEGQIVVDPEHFAVEYRIWDTARCKRLLRKRYRQGKSLDPKILARRAADDIVAAFVGVRGVSSTELAFVSDRTGNKEIYLMDADGGRQRPVTANKSINNFPSWSPKGDSIVYTSYRHRNQPNLFVTTRGRSQPQRLLVGLDRNLSQYRGVFGPLGRRIAVVMSDGGPSEIYRVVPGSRKLQRLTRNKSIDVSPTWSPNGKQIAFVSDRTGAPQIYVMDDAGKSSRRLTFNGSYNTAPTWSPDGKWIAYETRVGGQFDIWLIDPEGKVNVPLITHPRSDEAPSWAPNSRKLAFSSTRRGRADIYVVDLGGGSPRRITQGAGNNTAPGWGPFPD